MCTSEFVFISILTLFANQSHKENSRRPLVLPRFRLAFFFLISLFLIFFNIFLLPGEGGFPIVIISTLRHIFASISVTRFSLLTCILLSKLVKYTMTWLSYNGSRVTFRIFSEGGGVEKFFWLVRKVFSGGGGYKNIKYLFVLICVAFLRVRQTFFFLFFFGRGGFKPPSPPGYGLDWKVILKEFKGFFSGLLFYLKKNPGLAILVGAKTPRAFGALGRTVTENIQRTSERGG